MALAHPGTSAREERITKHFDGVGGTKIKIVKLGYTLHQSDPHLTITLPPVSDCLASILSVLSSLTTVVYFGNGGLLVMFTRSSHPQQADRRKTKGFGQLIRPAMEKRGLTQKEFAKRLGISEQYVSQILNDKKAPPERLLARAAAVLAVPLEQFGVSDPLISGVTSSERTTAVPTSAPADGSSDRRNHKAATQHKPVNPEEFSVSQGRMQGIVEAYIQSVMDALSTVRREVLSTTAAHALAPAAGKPDTLGLDSMSEKIIINKLKEFDHRSIVVTEESDPGDILAAEPGPIFFADPWDRSKKTAEAVKKIAADRNLAEVTLGELVMDPQFPMGLLEAPFGSITMVSRQSQSGPGEFRNARVVFNVLLDYVSGNVYVATTGLAKWGNIESCNSPGKLRSNGYQLCFARRNGYKCVTFLGRSDQLRFADGREDLSLYGQVFRSLEFDLKRDPIEPAAPGGPARVLYLADLGQQEQPTFVLSNGEKVTEWIGWLAFALAGGLSVYELHSQQFSSDGRPELFHARDAILMAPPPNYSLFRVDHNGGLALDLAMLSGLNHPSRYRGAIAVTASVSYGTDARLDGLRNGRRLFPPRS